MLTYGNETNRGWSTHDPNIDQGPQNTCAVRCQEIIMRDYGIQIPQDELRDFAEQQGWYNDGTPIDAVGNLLNTCGIETHVGFGNTVYDLINELQQGHRVIVGVDADELWAEPGSKEWEFYHQIDNANHALIVAGIKVDIENPANTTVILTDSGKGDVFIEYPMSHFAQAWKDSDFYMMATNEPAPYQYNELTEKMEYSNFATDYTVSEFPFHNEFSDIYDMAETSIANYEPYYAEGYLYNIAEGISHDDFVDHFEDNDTASLEELLNIEDIDDTWQQLSFDNVDNSLPSELLTDLDDISSDVDYSSDCALNQ